MSDLAELQARALAIKDLYDVANRHQRDRTWDVKDYAMGLVGDTGDLMKLVAAKEGVRAGTDVDSQLGHELADILWSILVIADNYDIDLNAEFERTMKYLQKRITEGQA